MTLQNLFLHPALSVFPVPPDLNKVITARSGKALDGLNGVGCVVWLAGLEVGAGCRGDQRARNRGWSPGYGVASNRVTVENVSSPLTIVCVQPTMSRQIERIDGRLLTFESENRNLSVRRGTGEDCSELVRSPRNRVYCRKCVRSCKSHFNAFYLKQYEGCVL